MLFVHGSATDHATWSLQLATLPTRLAMTAYDRRSTGTVAGEAADLATLVEPGVVLCGSSFGAVVALEVARARPADVRGLVLIEPPMGPADDRPVASSEFLADYDRLVDERGGEAAAEMFLRTVLGDAAFERMPLGFRARAQTKWREIRADSAALLAYRPRYDELARLDVPCLLVGGDRSASSFGATLAALAATLPRARREIVVGAGHMLHAERFRAFDELLVAFAERPEGV
nr:alpha/beta hydrolase [Kofleriaceae bacterium]